MNTKECFDIDKNTMPNHIAIIMDGNGRWAKKHGLPKKMGHKAGAETLHDITEAALELGVRYITVYAFSTENWKRSEEEVSGIMDLLRQYLKEHIKTAKKRDVRVKIIGEITKLDKDIQAQIAVLEDLTKDKDKITLNIALNYGGRDELIRGIKKIADDIKHNKILIEDITEGLIPKYLDTRDTPDPDIMIRTSGEERISNFLLWQLAYTEFDFSDKLWPDYNKEDLIKAIWKFQNKDRRFGGRNI